MNPTTRTERDSMGEMLVPASAYYGASTARAVENFPISNLRLPRRFIASLGLIKHAAADVNHSLQLLSDDQLAWVRQACQEVIDGKLDDQFVVDVFQTGSGTSTNMNANEVIATRANELATGARNSRSPVHPNDHVNAQQSSNDVIPTAIHLAASLAIRDDLIPALSHLEHSLNEKAGQFDDVIKIGRTHLQDATPVRLGQELAGYCVQTRNAVERAGRALVALRELPLGGTAVGTGINSHPDYAPRAVAALSRMTALSLAEAPSHFESQSAKDAVLEAAGHLRTIAISMAKIANDIRWLASGPRCGLGEVSIPATQPGSSIMPGKVNPVMSEMVLQVAAQVTGNDAAIAFAASPLGSTFELNVMMPVIAHNLLESISLLSAAARVFADRTVAGLDANRERCAALVEQSLSMATPLAPLIGYDRAADLAKESFKTNKTIRQLATEQNVLPPDQLKKALDPHRMTQPQKDMIGSGGG
jgi:fumarate hydratase class II